MSPKLEAKGHVQDIVVQPTAGEPLFPTAIAVQWNFYGLTGYLPKCTKHDLEIDSRSTCSTLSPFHAIKRLPVTPPFSRPYNNDRWRLRTHTSYPFPPFQRTASLLYELLLVHEAPHTGRNHREHSLQRGSNKWKSTTPIQQERMSRLAPKHTNTSISDLA
jgi:hypothetical protein